MKFLKRTLTRWWYEGTKFLRRQKSQKSVDGDQTLHANRVRVPNKNGNANDKISPHQNRSPSNRGHKRRHGHDPSPYHQRKRRKNKDYEVGMIATSPKDREDDRDREYQHHHDKVRERELGDWKHRRKHGHHHHEQRRSRSRSPRSRSPSVDAKRRRRYRRYTPSPPTPYRGEDDEGHLIYRHGDSLLNRYKILFTLGKGTFGKVVAAHDLSCNVIMALKINKLIDKEAAKLEIHVLKKLKQWDPQGKYLCVKMLDWFDYHGHIVICFEKLGLSVYDFLKQNGFSPYPLEQVKQMAFQLCYAVAFMHRNKLTHTDLKPENIMFVESDTTITAQMQSAMTPGSFSLAHGGSVSESSSGSSSHHRPPFLRLKNVNLKVIDFGGATFDYESRSMVVSTREYRAPEVIMELGWSQPCDVWSIGCILFEMYTGEALFQPHDNRELLAMMDRILGQIPPRLGVRSRTKYFRLDGCLWDNHSSESFQRLTKCQLLHCYMRNPKDKDTRLLFDLITKMLSYDPKKRITLDDALRHKFFDELCRNGVKIY